MIGNRLVSSKRFCFDHAFLMKQDLLSHIMIVLVILGLAAALSCFQGSVEGH